MKKNIFGIAILSTALILTSCGGNNQEKQNEAAQQAPTSNSSADLMSEGPAYDKTKIDPNAPVQQVNLTTSGNTMSEMKFDINEIRVKEGSTVKLVLTNKAKDEAMQHNFVLIEEGTADKVGPAGVAAGADKNYVPAMKEVLVATNLVGPGKMSDEITFPAPAKGVYDFICTYPGHYKTMNGKLIVE